MAKQPPTLDEFFDALEATGSEAQALARIEAKTTEWLNDKPLAWTGNVPAVDDFGKPISNAFVDGLTKHGRWAIMTIKSWRNFGVGLGTGRGQRYDLHHDGRWLKTEG